MSLKLTETRFLQDGLVFAVFTPAGLTLPGVCLTPCSADGLLERHRHGSMGPVRLKAAAASHGVERPNGKFYVGHGPSPASLSLYKVLVWGKVKNISESPLLKGEF